MEWKYWRTLSLEENWRLGGQLKKARNKVLKLDVWVLESLKRFGNTRKTFLGKKTFCKTFIDEENCHFPVKVSNTKELKRKTMQQFKLLSHCWKILTVVIYQQALIPQVIIVWKIHFFAISCRFLLHNPFSNWRPFLLSKWFKKLVAWNVQFTRLFRATKKYSPT